VALHDTFHSGYNETEGGETAPMICPQIRQRHKEAMARPEVRENFREAAKKRWADQEYVAKCKESFKWAYTPEVRARKSEATKKQRQDETVEIRRGIAKRITTLQKRVEKRAAMKTDEERRKFDLDNAKHDRYAAKHGRSRTQQFGRHV
jgi:hypothetical protein